MSGLLDRLRPHPARGDMIAAGAVPLAAAALIIDERMTQWPLVARLLVVGATAALLLTMAWLAPLEFDGPRSYHSVLLVGGLLTLLAALRLLAPILGATRGHLGTGALAWTFALEAAAAAAFARKANSAVCTLIAGLAGTAAVEAFVAFVFNPHGPATARAVLVVLSAGLLYGAARLRDRRPAHAVQLVNACGILTLVLAATLVASALLSTLSTPRVLGGVASGFGGVVSWSNLAAIPFGWKLYLLVVAFGLIAYGGADRQPGPAWLGAANLAAFVVIDGLSLINGATLVGWPLLLLALGAIGLGVGLRPMTPLPPEPETQPLPPRPSEED